MIMWLLKLIVFACFSSYLFPFEFTFLLGINTKMMMAALGVCVFLIRSLKQRMLAFNNDFTWLFVMAGMVSLVGYVSITYNDTPDTAYATYIVSMSVWLAAAYFVVSLIRFVHKKATFNLLVFYFVAVCVFQCAMALVIDNSPIVKDFVDAYVFQNQEFLTKGERLYGIGASLDTAGIRFAICVILLFYVLKVWKLPLQSYRFCVTALLFVLLVGSMIARTTLVGLLLGGGLFLYYGMQTKSFNSRKLLVLFAIVAVLGFSFIYLYNTDYYFREMARFGLEPFFNYFEGGELMAKSNENLIRMYVFPDNMKTWIIGDGYFANPHSIDPFYVGKTTSWGYYMGTDVGYLRLIFYFGLIGLFAFVIFFTHVTVMLCRQFPSNKIMFVAILLCGFCVWLKVSTDVFFAFALWLSLIAYKENEDVSDEFL